MEQRVDWERNMSEFVSKSAMLQGETVNIYPDMISTVRTVQPYLKAVYLNC